MSGPLPVLAKLPENSGGRTLVELRVQELRARVQAHRLREGAHLACDARMSAGHVPALAEYSVHSAE